MAHHSVSAIAANTNQAPSCQFFLIAQYQYCHAVIADQENQFTVALAGSSGILSSQAVKRPVEAKSKSPHTCGKYPLSI